ncbi:hypothetical protein SC206_16960 [Rouxiella sp. T17]|uniref:hypothetical protein n=1 Tax=Rouxiella sp. T17 TaxID=3085684 RepID=UPI002FCAAC07
MSVGNVLFSRSLIPLQRVFHTISKNVGKMFGNIKGVNNAKAAMKSQAPMAPLVNGLYGDKNHTRINLNQVKELKAYIAREPIYAQINKQPKMLIAEQFVQTASTTYATVNHSSDATINHSSDVVKPVIKNGYLIKTVLDFTNAVHDLKIKDESCLFARTKLFGKLHDLGTQPEKEVVLAKIREIKDDIRGADKLVTGRYPQEFNDAFERFEGAFRADSQA